jgi:hypothetical protein
MEQGEKEAVEARRSSRVTIQIPLTITSVDPATQFSEHCHTLVVSLQGCGVRLSRQLEPGTAVLLAGLPGGRSASACVAHSIPLGSGNKYWLVGLALDEPSNVWGIRPAPADWGEQTAAEGAVVSLPHKKDDWAYSKFSRKGEFHVGRK